MNLCSRRVHGRNYCACRCLLEFGNRKIIFVGIVLPFVLLSVGIISQNILKQYNVI